MTSLDLTWLVRCLEDAYGQAPPRPRFSPMDELVSCILSQHTADANSLPAFFRLKEAFSTWDDVVRAGPEKVAEVVRAAGLANQKAKSIVAVLQCIKDRIGEYSIDHLKQMPMREARSWLEELPGVGPKTASIVLCFCFGMDAVPMDTHVYRVAQRLGLVPPRMDANRAHDAILEVVPAGLAYRFHMALIQHGRNTCRAPKPRCERCVLSAVCPAFPMGSQGKVLPKDASK